MTVGICVNIEGQKAQVKFTSHTPMSLIIPRVAEVSVDYETKVNVWNPDDLFRLQGPYKEYGMSK